MDRLSWHQEQWQSLEQRLEQGRLPHALLMTGPQGIGKVHFAEQLAQGLLCERMPAAQYCGECQNCRLIASENHPDKKRVTFEVNPKDGKVARELKVDQVRGVSEALSLTSQFGGYKVAIVFPADRMNQNAANSLLKTLEEPTANTLLILITDFPSRLLPTIRSRCQELRFKLPERQQARDWLNQQVPGVSADPLLAMASGAPLLAKQAGEEGWLDLRNQYYSQLLASARRQISGVAMANEFAGEALDRLLIWSISWVNDLIRLKVAPDSEVINQDFIHAFNELMPMAETQALYNWYDDLVAMQRMIQGSLNPQQLLEKCFLDWQAIFPLEM